jgi:hypothetical protein
MEFHYNLANHDHVDEEKVAQAKDALSKGLFTCQQDFERNPNTGHEIHIFGSNDVHGAYVTDIKIDGNDYYVTLDCSQTQKSRFVNC